MRYVEKVYTTMLRQNSKTDMGRLGIEFEKLNSQFKM
jgi:hypothetical protein